MVLVWSTGRSVWDNFENADFLVATFVRMDPMMVCVASHQIEAPRY